MATLCLTPSLADYQDTKRTIRSTTKLVVLILLCMQATICWMARARSLRGEVDLRAFYTAGYNVRTGHVSQLYNYAFQQHTQWALFGDHGQTLPFLYPPFAALLFVPISFLPYTTAFCVILLGNLICLYLSARLLLYEHPCARLSSLLLTGFFLTIMPMAITLMQGQVSCLLLLLYTAFHHFTQTRKPFLAGLCLSFGLLKLQLVLPIVLLYLIWKQFSVIRGFFCGAFGLGLLSIEVAGRHGLNNFFTCLRGVSTTSLLDPGGANRKFGMQAAGMPNLHGIFVNLINARPLEAAVLLIVSAVILYWSGRQRPSIVAALPAAMLVSYHLQPYDLILLILPITLLYLELAVQTEGRIKPFALKAKRRKLGITLVIGSVVLLLAPLAPYLVSTGLTCWFVLAVGGVLAGSGLLCRSSSLPKCA